MNLVIVESPAKGRTISKYLGGDYKVAASFGHVRDLPKKELGVDAKNDFKPDYIIIPKARKTISYLKKQLEGAKKLYLATDYDREGEAIGWHLVKALELENQKKVDIERITFHEITKQAIQEALKNPREIDMNLVNAQQARRILDRLVGYKLSPFLWEKITKGLSAGRVQTVALRLIVDREREIANFKPVEFWSIEATLSKKDNVKKTFIATCMAKDDKTIDKLAIKTKKEADQILSDLKNAAYKVEKIDKQEKSRYPFPPFTTSTLQQECYRRLQFSSQKTMKLAQQLYEAGYITYMRTDSTNLSWLAINSIRKYIKKEFGEKYLSEKARVYKSKQAFAQEAHEAIRPTFVANILLPTKKGITEDHHALYQLIWSRSVACQMKEAILAITEVFIKAANYTFVAVGQTLQFEGFTKIYPVKIDQSSIPLLKIAEILSLIKLENKQNFTKPPYRFNPASLIKELEEKGIGRPSTYAPIISILLYRGYAFLQKGFFTPSEIGMVVCDIIKENFPEIIDYNFTAKMESDLDKIAQGKEKYQKILGDFYWPFQEKLDLKIKEVPKTKIALEKIDEKCPKCGGKLAFRLSRFGRFIGCSNFPKCRYTKSMNGKKACPPVATPPDDGRRGNSRKDKKTPKSKT